MKVYLDTESWVELLNDRTIVSWPGGHKTLDCDATLEDLLDVLVGVLADARAARLRESARRQAGQYQAGYEKGWHDGHKGRAKSA